MLTTSILAVALVAGSAVAQTATKGSTALNFTYIDPTTVDPQIAASWCIGERTGCQTLCDGNAPTNDCDAQKLTYKCLCDDGSTPDLAEYKNTLPDYVCQANFAGCIKAHPNDAVGQGNCKTEIQDTCGTKSITDYKKGSGSGSGGDDTSSDSSSETDAPSSTSGSGGAGGAADATQTSGDSTPSSTQGSGKAAATSDSAAVALTNGMDIGAGVLAAGVVGLFGYIL
ncbi:hypothetical protein V495_07590 [Pseudogymnoascus sp. VKM F-4514 (FW-929)]|nr:hypothetical protein V495_07590 [Pseudogymnoascus sp. VKM F-4514 (FW-929)]KFY55741.1 hypothetical protein V497_06769 [Pseudogymnoascus sp. VKM F-4516 (FW-969)]